MARACRVQAAGLRLGSGVQLTFRAPLAMRWEGLHGLPAIVGPAAMPKDPVRQGSILEEMRQQGRLGLRMLRSDARRGQPKCGHEEDDSGANDAEEDVTHGDHRRCDWRVLVNPRTAFRFPKLCRKNVE